ncbi:MAG: hypothetical protein SGBAC_010419 [Bacillariaceae sp.]
MVSVSLSSSLSSTPLKKKRSVTSAAPLTTNFLILILALMVLACLWVNLMFSIPLSSSAPLPSLCNENSNLRNQLTLPAYNGSSTATVMGMATGYDLAVYKQFVGSLLKTGYSGNIILVISPDPAPGVEDYLSSKGVVMKRLQKVECDTQIIANQENAAAANSHQKEVMTCAHPYPNLKVRWGRFPILRDHLEACSTCTGPVLVTDVRDAFFQLDPFGDGAPPVTGLQVFEEFKFQRTTHWLVKTPVSKCKGIEIDETMLCSGTTIGTRKAILDYLETMHKEMVDWMKDPKCCCNPINGDDQSIHNYLFYTGRFSNAQTIKNRMGIVHTVGHQATLIFRAHEASLARDFPHNYTKDMAYKIPLSATSADQSKSWLGIEYDLVDEDGYFLNYDGSRSRVVHQYDRFRSQIKKWLNANIGDK